MSLEASTRYQTALTPPSNGPSNRASLGLSHQPFGIGSQRLNSSLSIAPSVLCTSNTVVNRQPSRPSCRSRWAHAGSHTSSFAAHRGVVYQVYWPGQGQYHMHERPSLCLKTHFLIRACAHAHATRLWRATELCPTSHEQDVRQMCKSEAASRYCIKRPFVLSSSCELYRCHKPRTLQVQLA